MLLATNSYRRKGNQNGLQAMARRLVDLEGFYDDRLERVAEAEQAARTLGRSWAQAVATALRRVGDGEQVRFTVQEARQFLLSGMRGLSLEIEPSTSGRGAA